MNKKLHESIKMPERQMYENMGGPNVPNFFAPSKSKTPNNVKRHRGKKVDNENRVFSPILPVKETKDARI